MYFNTSNKLTNPYLTSKKLASRWRKLLLHSGYTVLDDTYCLKRTSMYPEYVNSVTVTG